MLALLLAGCAPGDGAGDASIDVGGLFPASLDRYAAYRHLTATQYAETTTDAPLDEEDLLLTRFDEGGCGGDAWRVELRNGSAWESAAPIGALHFEDASGLAVCAWEDAEGTVASYDPPAVLWENGAGLTEGEPVSSGSWEVTPHRVTDLATYFGVFPQAVSFTLAGDGTIGGWTLHLADGFGLVLLQSDTFTADLVYSR